MMTITHAPLSVTCHTRSQCKATKAPMAYKSQAQQHRARTLPSSMSSLAPIHSQQQRRPVAASATPDEERAIEDMKRDAQSGGIWDSDTFSTVFKVAVVATFVAVSIGIAKIGEPVIQAIIQAFPVNTN